jgi:hypothetical protein
MVPLGDCKECQDAVTAVLIDAEGVRTLWPCLHHGGIAVPLPDVFAKGYVTERRWIATPFGMMEVAP